MWGVIFKSGKQNGNELFIICALTIIVSDCQNIATLVRKTIFLFKLSLVRINFLNLICFYTSWCNCGSYCATRVCVCVCVCIVCNLCVFAGGITHEEDPDLIGHPVRLNQSGVFVPVQAIAEYDAENSPRVHNLPIPVITEAQRITADPYKRKAVVFMTIICLSVFFALGTLTLLHAKNISRGETSIESHINATLRKTHTRHQFRNPYNFGREKNWKLFLGLTQGRTFIRHVLLPSSHPPNGTGLTWHTVNNAIEDWP